MKSKDRVLKAISHQKPDRVPMNYKANAGIDRKLKEHFSLKQHDDEGLRLALGIDFRDIRAVYKGPRLHQERPDMQVDPEWGICRKWIEHQSGGYWDYCDWPLKNAGLEEIEAWPMPSPDDYDYSHIPALCEKYSDYCLITSIEGYGDIINSTGWLRGMEQVFMDLITNDPAGMRLVDRRHDTQVEVLNRTLQAGNGKFDMVWLGEDLGTQIAPMVSMEVFIKQIKPRLQRFIDVAKQWNLPVMFHCCGSSSWAFDELAAMGINIVDTLQPEATNMSPEYLKKKFGSKLAFHGCISTAGPLTYGTVDQVRKNVNETLDIMMAGGGYCLAPTHSIQDNSPTENVLAMYDQCKKYGIY